MAVGVEESVGVADIVSVALPEELCEALALLVALGEEWLEGVLEALTELEALAVLLGDRVKPIDSVVTALEVAVVVGVLQGVGMGEPVEV